MGGFQQRFAALSSTRKLIIMAVLAALIAALIGAALWSREPAYRILFTNIPDKEAGAVVQSLQQMNIPYKLDAGGISVPADKIYDARLRLAAEGLPKSGNVGFELIDNQKFGVSQFAEQVNYQRAIEGELARSIETISSVEKARVHLAIPKQSVFLRDQQKPTASVILTLHTGRLLDDAQVAGIVHLVSSSVPDLMVKNVTVVDQDGSLLSNNNRINQANLDQKQLQYVAQIERGYVERVQAILAPLVGKDNVRAEVTAQLDFSEVEQTSETYKPNSPPNAAAIRSQQTLDQQGRSSDPGAMGVPGALSNQPPGAAAAPITAPIASEVAGGIESSSNVRREATTNYEIDKTIQHVKQPVGSIKRLSAAVVINFKPGKDKDGKAGYVPFTPQEMTQINNLVREAIGYNQTRGDSVNVVNAAFADSQPLEERPLVDKASDYLKTNWPDVLKLFLLAVAVLYLLFFIVRPLMKDIARSGDAEGKPLQLDLGDGLGGLTVEEAVAGESGKSGEEDQAKMAAFADLLQQAKELAKNDPRMVATILREWMSEEDGKNDNPNKVA
ncbi:flagellar basal-body MS-ring/collar protein FliF [Chitinilyticum litopenaei]|uniref:flagellar basal-body MS-ring/collar protein FliF n=1 Tax=Chitinilyticum litopenaei TaxID=1121276 RepID=UPI00040CE18A|nr:flagellar basal-body MS-ring/collar protein FliF [Chitinilyticum litopenaei]